MTVSDENLSARSGNGRRYDDLKAGSEKYLFGFLQIIVILMLGWGGTNVIDNGKALARVETRMVSFVKQGDSLTRRQDKLSDRVLILEKITR